MGAQDLITQRDLNKVPQSVVEGNTAATYGVTPTNPTFAAHGQDAVLIEGSDPTVAEKRIAGNVDRQEITKTREKNTVTYRAKFMAADKALLQSVANLPNGANTPDESRTFFYSYDDDSGTEQFVQFLGCKPQSYSISVDPDGYLILEIVYTCKTITADTSGPTIGSGSYGTALTGTPLTHDDAGAAPFTHDSDTLEVENFTHSGSYNEAVQNSLGSIKDLYRKPTQRIISGSVVIFKSDDTEQTDARAATQVTASYILDSGNITFSYTRFRLLPSGEELVGDGPDATKENKSWEADMVSV